MEEEELQASNGHKGLAIYRSPNMLKAFRVPRELTESVSVGDHFNIVPLLPMLNADQTFYILALSQRHIRLLRCTSHSSEEVALPDSIPKTLWEDKQSDQPDHDQNNMATGGPSTGSMRGVISSTNTDREDRGEYLMHFYKHVDKGVTELLKKEGAPLVIAGVDYETAMYRKESTYPQLVEEPVHGAPDGLKGGELHKRALEAVQSYFEIPLAQALARYEKQAGGERASTTVKEIVKGAFDGRVAELILAEGTIPATSIKPPIACRGTRSLCRATRTCSMRLRCRLFCTRAKCSWCRRRRSRTERPRLRSFDIRTGSA